MIQRLHVVAAGLDPLQMPRVVFDPSNPEVVGTLIGDTMLEQPRMPLGLVPRFHGSGVYSIYYDYNGDFPAYLPISGTGTPIYVGKADPAILDASALATWPRPPAEAHFHGVGRPVRGS